MNVEVGKTYVFKKSGNIVRALQSTGKGQWLVERTAGASAGKRMIISSSQMAEVLDQDEAETGA